MDEYSESEETGLVNEVMGEKIKTEMAKNHKHKKGQNQNPLSPQNKGPVPKNQKKRNPKVESKLKTPNKGVAGRERKESLKRKEKVYTPSVKKYFKKVEKPQL